MKFRCAYCVDPIRHYHDKTGKVVYTGCEKSVKFIPGERVVINGCGFVDEEGVVMDPDNLPKGWALARSSGLSGCGTFLVKPDCLNLNGFWIPEHCLSKNPFIDPPNTVDELPSLTNPRITQ